MSIYRQVIDGVIVNRIVVDDTKPGGGGLPDDFPYRDTYEIETETPPPQVGWTSDGNGGWVAPPEDPEPEPEPDPVLERLAALEAEVTELRKSRG